MTLHWWMHWFWVTLWFTVTTGIPLASKNRDEASTITSSSLISEDKIGSSTATPEYKKRTESVELLKETAVIKESFSSSSPAPSIPPLPPPPSSLSLSSSSLINGENFRIPKAIGINPPPPPPLHPVLTDFEIKNPSPINVTILNSKKNDYSSRSDREAYNNAGDKRDSKISVLKNNEDSFISGITTPSKDYNNISSSNYTGDINNNNNNNNKGGGSTLSSNRSLSLIKKKDSKVTWLLTGNKTSSARNDHKLIITEEERKRNSSLNNNNDDEDDNLAVLPLQEPIPTRFKLVLNKTKIIPSTNLNDDNHHVNDDNNNNNKLLLNKSEDVEIREDIIEPRILATAASILQGVSESPRLSRARSAFPGDYQQDEQQEQRRGKPSENGFANSTSSAMDIAAVTGSCLATIVLIGTMGSLGFVMYRRRYMNPPQTLNSDKCSNPDSSGYIDDSTIRDNSEEMYSLDNDSFLNSLEAMTIQNYWTDSVKHTKL